jgi:hypothetical protein
MAGPHRGGGRIGGSYPPFSIFFLTTLDHFGVSERKVVFDKELGSCWLDS